MCASLLFFLPLQYQALILNTPPFPHPPSRWSNSPMTRPTYGQPFVNNLYSHMYHFPLFATFPHVKYTIIYSLFMCLLPAVLSLNRETHVQFIFEHIKLTDLCI